MDLPFPDDVSGDFYIESFRTKASGDVKRCLE